MQTLESTAGGNPTCAQRKTLVPSRRRTLLAAAEDHRCRVAVALRLAAVQPPSTESIAFALSVDGRSIRPSHTL